ncbi:MAG: sulfatase-like hydrolase/transferase [Parvicellaceae bacterium]
MISIKKILLLIIGSILLYGCSNINPEKSFKKQNDDVKSLPNILIIYTDDLGFGDISANGAKEIKTPNIDYLADNGMRFTNGYSSSATCTPSRYALLTGEYPWKNKKAKILPGTAPLIIDTAMMTMPKWLSEKGYYTGIVGKWHLGLGNGNVNWNKKVSPGPNEIGFDFSHIMAATQDRVPTVYIENGNVVGLDVNDPIEISYKRNFEGQPTGKKNPELLTMKWHHGHNMSIVNGIPRIGFMNGGEKAKWSDIDMADHFLNKAKHFVKEHNKEPFFLYYAMQQPHVPRTPHPRFVGKSGMGPRGDVIIEADWCIGELIKTLEEQKLLENTLIIFTSDNGPVLNDGYYDDAVEKIGKHDPKGGLRGGKYSLFEAGTNVPFISFWKGKISSGVSDQLICQLDLFKSIAKLVDTNNIIKNDGLDLLDLIIGKESSGRESLVIEATSRTAFKKGDFVMIPPYKGAKIAKAVNIELGNSENYMLFDLKEDPNQQHDLSETKPEILNELINEFETIRGDFSNYNKIELK